MPSNGFRIERSQKLSKMKLTRASELKIDSSNEKCEQILKGAMQEFLVRGYAGTSMEKVAAAAGVSKPTVYSYFKDKEVLFQFLIEDLAQKKFNSTFGSEIFEGEPSIVLRKIAEVTFSKFDTDEEFSSFMRTIVGESGRFPQLAKICVRNLFKPVHEKICTYLTAHPELKISDPSAAALLFINTLAHYHVIQDVLHGKDTIQVDRSQMVDTLMEMMLKSIEE
jgi:TetR/AcrR family transcriptional regulator, regulator of autoinduction and epiphytic fitness